MERRLVTTNEAARHPFRQYLPLSTDGAALTPEPANDRSDVRLFILTFLTAFAGFYTFIF
jgi:hypothetical protein